MFIQRGTVVAAHGPILILSCTGFNQGGSHRHIEIHWRKFGLRGWIFARAESIVKQGSDKFLRVPDVVSFPRVMHNGKVGLVPVVIDVWKDLGLSMEPDQ